MSRLADLVLVLHASFALFVVGGLGGIWLGHVLGKRWVRNRPFRLLHLGAIGFVAITSVIGVACPLTVLEDTLRGGEPGPQGFIQRWVGRLLYYDFPGWVFTVAYVAFALAVILTWYLIPPRRRI